MTYKMYLLSFQTAHFGTGKLDSSAFAFSADRLFSALFIEAIKMGKEEEFLSLAQEDDFVLSDAFPFDGMPFLPKPIGYPKRDKLPQVNDVAEQRKQAKKTKKLTYIRLDKFKDFLNGKLLDNQDFGKLNIVTKNQPFKDGHLFQVRTITYKETVSLYLIAKQSQLFDELMKALQFSGLGGKRSSGYGRFELEIKDVPEKLAEHLTFDAASNVMALTTALPVDDDLTEAMRDGQYLLTKSSGFAFSSSHQSNYRKQDFYKFKAGSTFSKSFRGQIADIRPIGFSHPVWNFAKPLFYKLEV
ncbi:CRISPR-associated RAMP protein, Csm4 family [Streptococcus sp. DD11]|uniref:type III-A CRISPR-associated RAMP protein Csm4 n=1 Tax=Streptococcus sp. DD11 TaxID=1777879 RepID=UPI00079887D1|nr:type III-A CRISPR-associated RAMP protein Csm4 [Streptococcus sp. DD11]KXT78673.1 CRISPR-associated RAMP protein, Csm4 family [Streptococcus sp. DD11]